MSFSTVNANSKAFFQLKKQVDKLENTIIQDFSLELPKNMQQISLTAQAKLAKRLEIKYRLQTKLFYKLEGELTKIDQRLFQQTNEGKLTFDEAEKIKTRIDYANRIILKSRKAEISSIYSRLKSQLIKKPKLKDIYSKLLEFQIKTCSINNIIYNKAKQILSFEVKQKNNFGGWNHSEFSIHEKQLTKGQLLTKLDHSANSKETQENSFETHYWQNDAFNNGSQGFTLVQSLKDGSIKEAKFFDKYREPLISFMELHFGSQKIEKNFECQKAKTSATTKEGPKPASLSFFN